MYRNEPKEPQKGVEHCAMCGDPTAHEEGYYRIHGMVYCTGCLDFSDAETLIRICEIPKRKWFEQMGFEYVGNAKIRGRIYGS